MATRTTSRPQGPVADRPAAAPRWRLDGDRSTFGTFWDLNLIGLWTLYLKEVRRFVRVWTQTLMAPIITTLVFLAIFTLALGGAARTVEGVPYLLVPGPGSRHDDHRPERLRQHLLLPRHRQGPGQHRRLSDAAPLGGRAAVRADDGGRHAGGDGRRRGLAGHAAVRADGAAPPLADRLLRHCRLADAGASGHARGALGREVRPAGGGDQLRHHPALLPLGHLLLDRPPARAFSSFGAPQSLLLHDRRHPLRLHRPCRRQRRWRACWFWLS